METTLDIPRKDKACALHQPDDRPNFVKALYATRDQHDAGTEIKLDRPFNRVRWS